MEILGYADGEPIWAERWVPPPPPLPRRRRGTGSFYRRASDGIWCGKIELPTGRGEKRKCRVVAHTTFCGMLLKFSAIEKPDGFTESLTRPREKYGSNRKEHMAAARAIATHTDDEWYQQQMKQRLRCYYCGHQRPLGKDHKVPVSRGGSDGIDNIVGACWPCNFRKRDKTANEFARYIGIRRRPHARGNPKLCECCGHKKGNHREWVHPKWRDDGRCNRRDCLCRGYIPPVSSLV